MQGADQAEKQGTRAEKRQEQKQVRALLRQVKGVEREQRRQRETARLQRRHLKQRQVSRACERTQKFDLHWYEDEIDGDMDMDLPRKRRAAEWRQLRGYPSQQIDGQGWKIVAIYRIERYTPPYIDDWDWTAWGHGRFLAYNVHRREVLLSEYWSRGGCPCCEAVGSMDAMKDIMDQSPGVPTESGFLASAEEFLDCAQQLVDPAMKLRRAMPEDVGYHSLVTLYAMYTLFYSRVVRGPPSSHRRQHVDFGPIAAWSPREWDLAAYNAVVRLQALWRGWHFRQRVLYSPHTELGCRYLLRAWHRECNSQI